MSMNYKDAKFWAVVAIATLLMIVIAKLVFGKSDAQKEADAQNDAANSGKLGTITYADSVYRSLADDLQGAIDRLMFEDFGTVERVFNKMNTDADVAKLIGAYGSRKVTAFPGAGIFYGSMTLQQIMNKSLSAHEIEQVNDILAGKGITYTF